MPIVLTTPADPGDNDPGQSYSRAKIIRFLINLNSKYIDFVVAYGDVVDDSWVPGKGLKHKEFRIDGDEFNTMMAESALVSDGASQYEIYAGAKRVLYQWLIDNGHAAGTVE